ncbi:MAG: hypothetical protein IJ227_03595, partial [Mogibacterium sp.]|nr:hypothetical protein [Mogibacterium sp.]
MKNNRFVRALFALLLAFTMTVTSIPGTFAFALAVNDPEPAVTEEAAAETTEATEEQADETEETAVEAGSEDSEASEEAAVEEDADSDEDAVEEDAEEEKEAASKTEYVFKDDKVKVTAKLSDASAVSDDAELVVTYIDKNSEDYNYDAYMKALNKDSDSVYSEGNTLLYDIAFIEDGIEVQPAAGTVSVSFEFLDSQLSDSLGAAKAADINVVHLPLADEVKDQYDTTAEAKDISVGDISVQDVTKEDNALKVSVKNEKVVFETKDFSVFAYTVDFEYDGYTYSIPGGTEIELSKVFKQLNIDKKVSDVMDVKFSNEKLVEVNKNVIGNDWTLKSKKAFSSEETLTVTMKDGSTIAISVTDAQEYQVVVNFYNYDKTTPAPYSGETTQLYAYLEIEDNDRNVVGWAVQSFNPSNQENVSLTFNKFGSLNNTSNPDNNITFDSDTYKVSTARLYSDYPTYHLVNEDLESWQNRPNDTIDGCSFLTTTV